MDTLRDKRLLRGAVGVGRCRRGGHGVTDARSRHVLARPADASSPAPPGSVGGWLVRRLVDAGADVVCLVRDWVPQSRASSRSVSIGGCSVVRGDVRDQALLERALGEYEIDTVIHLAAQTIVGDRQPQPGLDVRDEHRAAPGRCSRPAAAARRSSRSCVASSDKAYGDQRRSCPTPKTTPLAGRHPYDVQQVVRRPDRPDLRAHLRPAGRDHALRQLLRRRRPQLEPHRAGHDPLGAPRRAAGHPLRRHVRPRLLLRRGRRPRYLRSAARPRGQSRSSRARRSTSRPTSRSPCSSSSSGSAA